MPHVRPLQWVTLTTAVIACLWFATGQLDPFNIPKLAVLVVGAAVLIGMLGAFWKHWFKRDEWPVWGSVGLFIVGLSAAGIASDQNVYRTLWGAWARNDGWFAYAALAIITLGVALAFRGRDVTIGLYVLAGVGVLEIAYALLQTTGNDPIKWNNGYNPILGTVGNPNFASALIGICGVVLAWIALEPTHTAWLRVPSAVVSLIAVWITDRSESVQGTLAWGAGIAILLGGWLWTREQRWLRRLFWPYMGMSALAALIAVIGMLNVGPTKSFMYSQNLVNRTYYWRAGWRMFKDHPVFGVGLDSFGDYYRVYRLPEQVAVTGVQTVSNAAHSVVFQMLATGGLALFVTYLLLQTIVGWRGVIALRRGDQTLLVAGLLGAWLAFTLQSLFSIDQLGLTVWGWVLAGLVIGVSYPRHESRPNARGRRAAASTVDSSVMVALVAGVVLGLGGVVLASGPLATDAGVRNAISYGYDPASPNTNAQAAIVQAVLASVDGAQDPIWRIQAVNKLYQIGAVAQGISLGEQSARMFPKDASLADLVALAYEQTGRKPQAVEWRARALELDPLNTNYAKLLADDKAAK